MPMPMPERVRNINMIRTALLALAILLLCCGLLAGSALGLSKNTGFFQANVLVENLANETLTITPITTTYAEPRVIRQVLAPRQRDHLLEPNASILLTYDTADFPLAGIIVCRENGNCRVLKYDGKETLSIEDFNSLPSPDESWLAAIEKTGLYNYAGMIYLVFLIISLILFGIWWLLGKKNEKSALGY